MRGSVPVLAIAAVLCGVSGASAQDADSAPVVALADQGLLECVRPNVSRKTCRAIAAYERIQEGVYTGTTLMAVGNGVTLEIYTPVWRVDDAFCGSIREQDVMTAIVRMRGREVAPQLAESALYQALRQLRPLIDQQACTRYEPSGANFIARTTIGEASQNETVRMVSPADGYRVAD